MNVRLQLFLIAALLALVPPLSAAIFTFNLDGQQAGTNSEATGIGFVGFNEEDNHLEIVVEHTLENAIAAHIHRARAGQNGGVVFPFDSPASPIRATWDSMSAADIEALLAGELYVNIHSSAHAGGEIRGQIVPSLSDSLPGYTFTFMIQASQANRGEGVESDASGSGFGVLAAGGEWFFLWVTHDVENATAMHVHQAPPGENGGVVLPFPNADQESDEFFFMNGELIDALWAGNLYFNIHSEAYAGGEIRGQIVQSVFDFEPEVTFSFAADGSQANAGAGTGSEAIGKFLTLLNLERNTVKIFGEHSVENATVAHIHRGARGVNGGVVFPFRSGASPIKESWRIDSENLIALEAGELYVNIHSGAHAGGEIRGQIVDVEDLDWASVEVGLDGSQANAGAGVETDAMGFFEVHLSPDGSMVGVRGFHDVDFTTAAHIHRGAPNENGPPIFTLESGFGSVFDVWFIGEEDLADLVAGNLYIQVHSRTFAGGEIRGQIPA